MLPARAGGAEHLHFVIIRLNFHIRVVGDFRDDLDRREGGVPPPGRVKGGNAHQAVNARFTL